MVMFEEWAFNFRANSKFIWLTSSRPSRQVNVLVSEQGEACLADFGLSEALGGEHNFQYSSTFNRAGHMAWMAPELLVDNPEGGGVRRTIATDVFSFGRLIYEVFNFNSIYMLRDLPKKISLRPATRHSTA